MAETIQTHIFVDADACPVKNEVYKVAKRYSVPVTLVTNSWMNTPNDPNVHLELVGDGFDEADEWIVEHVKPKEIVITADIPLAKACIDKDALVLGHKGRIFTEESIGEALARREVASQLREHGLMGGGSAPFSQKDRSRFLERLDTAIHKCK